MKMLSNMRKAVSGRDDTTLTRWVKEPGRAASEHKTTPMPASATRTRFRARVMPVAEMPSILVSGHNNVKIGRDVRKGHLRGYWIYTLSLEERATCPSTCAHWTSCYGNAMPFAKRVDHLDPAFLPALEAEIERLVNVRGRRGILIRLHALGDFYSQVYVQFWRRMLAKHRTLAIFGYTARRGDIGSAIVRLNLDYGRRCMIRFSSTHGRMSAITIPDQADCPPGAFVCPEQTGRTACCATCGACWSTEKPVAFLEH